MSMGGKSDMVDQGWVGVMMMGYRWIVTVKSILIARKSVWIGNGSRRVLRNLRDGLSNDLKGDDGMVVAKREWVWRLWIDGCSVLSLSLLLSAGRAWPVHDCIHHHARNKQRA
jgi:hypothetical protein